MRERFGDRRYPEKGSAKSVFALDDYLFLKYLLATSFDLTKASDLLEKNLEWRSQIRPEQLNWEMPGLRRECVTMGKSRKGNPVLFCKMAYWQPSLYTEESYLRSRVLEMEEARRDMARDGWRVDRIIIINDMRGYSFFEHANPHAYRLAKEMMLLFGTYYRDSIETIFVLNAPIIFKKFWSICLHFTQAEVLPRIRFENDVTVLQQLIDSDNIFTE
jgi:hypothetical protein